MCSVLFIRKIWLLLTLYLYGVKFYTCFIKMNSVFNQE